MFVLRKYADTTRRLDIIARGELLQIVAASPILVAIVNRHRLP
ncbi:MAG: hypothetical protein PHH47_10615 [Gallionella sp.]|nr:hypothetical protein [Gallionella sp.]MDD4947536.1 hypothetical protein [Gallionella sp.]MDD5613210.1 hypothetical protein [Gallionella sp.]